MIKLFDSYFKRFARLQHFEECFLFLYDMHQLRIDAGKPLDESERRATMEEEGDWQCPIEEGDCGFTKAIEPLGPSMLGGVPSEIVASLTKPKLNVPGQIPGTAVSFKVPMVRKNYIENCLQGTFNLYIKAGAKYEISCSDKDRDAAHQRITNQELSVDMFKDIERDMMVKLRTDAFPRFLNSKFYDHYRHAHFRKFTARAFVTGNDINTSRKLQKLRGQGN